MSSWMCTILGPPGSVHENRIYSLRLFCDKDYPQSRPQLRFISKVNMSCVNQRDGTVDPNGVSVLKNWNKNYTIEVVLTEIRKEMVSGNNKKAPQPPEGSTF